MTDGRWVCAGLDRNGLRPMRYVVTGDGLVIAGSEAGMVPIDEATVTEKGALGPGQMLAVDMKKGKLFRDTQIKDKLARALPFGEWVGKINDLDDTLAGVSEKVRCSPVRNCASVRSRRAIRSRNWSRSCPDGRGRQRGAGLDGR